MEYKVFLYSASDLKNFWLKRSGTVEEEEVLSQKLSELAKEGWAVSEVIVTPIVSEYESGSKGLPPTIAEPPSTYVEAVLYTVLMQK